MKKLLCLLLAGALAFSVAACGNGAQDSEAAEAADTSDTAETGEAEDAAEETAEEDGQNILIAYFSASGETAKLAKTLSAVTGGDLFEIRPETAYTSADLNWMDKKSRSTLEMKDEHSRPAIAGRVEDMAQYGTVFVGFPIWWYQAPRIIETFLESYDFTGKTVIPFATSGGSGMGKTADILRTVCPAADILPGKRMSAHESAEAVRAWLETLGK